MPTSETSKTFLKCCFTDHNVEEEPDFSDKLRYLGYAKETAPTTGKQHWQGFAYAKTAMRLTGWKKLFPGAHIEAMRGDFNSNTIYCSKEGLLIEHGLPPRQGERTDLQELKFQLDAGRKPMEIADEVDGMFGVVARTERFCENYSEYKRRKRLVDDRSLPEVHIRWGPPGSGKTKWMDDTYGTNGWTRAPDNTGKWFDGCDCDVILFDDVKANEVPSITQVIRLCDRYPIQVKRHNGFLTWKPRVIVFTSNYKPTDWWPNEPEISYRAFERRITNIEHVV
jgi:hypothetical protein